MTDENFPGLQNSTPSWKTPSTLSDYSKDTKNYESNNTKNGFGRNLPKLVSGLVVALFVAAIFAYLLDLSIPIVLRPFLRSIDPYDTNSVSLLIFIGFFILFGILSLGLTAFLVRTFSNNAIAATSGVLSFFACFIFIFGYWFYLAKAEQAYKLETNRGLPASEVVGEVGSNIEDLCFKVYLPSYWNESLLGPNVTGIAKRPRCETESITLVYYPLEKLHAEIIITEEQIDREIRPGDRQVTYRTIAGHPVRIEQLKSGYYFSNDNTQSEPVIYLFNIDKTKIELLWYKREQSVLTETEIEEIISSFKPL